MPEATNTASEPARDTAYQAGSGHLRDRHIAGDQRENCRCAAGEKNQLDFQAVLGEDSAVLGNPGRNWSALTAL